MIKPVAVTDGANKRATTVLVAVVVTLTAAHLFYYLPRVVDDLFISLRYAENLVHGRGLVYNVGERVEGFSSPLWAFLQALGLALHVEGVLWTKVLGVVSLGLLHLGLYRFTREVFAIEAPVAFLPNVMLALDSYVIAWSTFGLETPAHLALVFWCFVLARRVAHAEASRATRVATIAVLTMMAAARPEGIAWAILAVSVEVVVGPLARPDVLARARRLARVVVPAAAIVVLLLVLRRVYYDDWVPNTYYAKAADAGISPGNLRPLWTGAPIEAIALFGGVGLLAVASLLFGQLQRGMLPGLVIVAFTVFFAAVVEVDWMPSLRHFLPLLVVAPVGLAWLAGALSRRNTWLAAGVVALACAAGAATARIDLRSMLDPFPGGALVSKKSREKLAEVVLSLRRIEPPHVAAMDAFQMGMITQNYRVLEASAAPLESSWYLGRDIGKVGYYTDVKVFETAGLFTPAVVDDGTWRATRVASEALLSQALAKRPIAIEWFEWAFAAGSRPRLIAPWHRSGGSAEAPVDLELGTPGPEPAEILRRYQRSLDKFPHAFLLATLHGESVGGAMARRTRIVRELVAESEAMGPPPEGAVPNGSTLDHGGLVARGCIVHPPKLKAGSEATVRCWFDVARATRKPWTFFVHFVDAKGQLQFAADHAPASGLLPSWRWRDGMSLRDFARFTVPVGTPTGIYGVRIGLFWGRIRAVAAGPASETSDRLVGPNVEVVQ